MSPGLLGTIPGTAVEPAAGLPRAASDRGRGE